MGSKYTEKSKKVLKTLNETILVFRTMLDSVSEEKTKQTIYRAIVIFLCSGIDATIKQLIKESLAYVIERDEGARNQLKQFVSKEILNEKKEAGAKFLSIVLTSKNPRKTIIDSFITKVSFDSLQSAEQLFRTAGCFDISTESILKNTSIDMIKKVFSIRNRIAHQMDIDFSSNEVEQYLHKEIDIFDYCESIKTVCNNFIEQVENKLNQPILDKGDPLMIVNGEELFIVKDLLQ